MTTDLISTRPALTVLSDEETMFRDAVAEFAEEQVRPRVQAMDRDGQLDRELIPKFFELGLMGIEVPESFGGAGGSLLMVTLAVEAISRVDASAAILMDVQNTLVNNPINRYGSDAQKRTYLTQLSAEKVGAYALSEPGSGSDAFALAARAEQQGDRWILNGRKMWMSRGSSPAICEVQRDLRLQTRHRLNAQASAIGQPLCTHDVFERLAFDVDPGRRADVRELSDSKANLRIRAAGPRISLLDDPGRERLDIGEVREIDLRIVRLKIRDPVGIGSPPVSDIASSENLFPIHPRQGSIEKRLGAILSYPNFAVGIEIKKVEIVLTNERDTIAVRRKAGRGFFRARRSQTAQAGIFKFENENVAVETVKRTST
jgi:hypothetical protein